MQIAVKQWNANIRFSIDHSRKAFRLIKILCFFVKTRLKKSHTSKVINDWLSLAHIFTTVNVNEKWSIRIENERNKRGLSLRAAHTHFSFNFGFNFDLHLRDLICIGQIHSHLYRLKLRNKAKAYIFLRMALTFFFIESCLSHSVNNGSFCGSARK